MVTMHLQPVSVGRAPLPHVLAWLCNSSNLVFRLSAGVRGGVCGDGGSRGLHHQLALQPALHGAGGTGPDLCSHGERC